MNPTLPPCVGDGNRHYGACSAAVMFRKMEEVRPRSAAEQKTYEDTENVSSVSCLEHLNVPREKFTFACAGVVFLFLRSIRILSENQIMIETLEKRELEIQQLRTENSGKRATTRLFVTFDCIENLKRTRVCVCVRWRVFAALNQQCSELISILDLREQRVYRVTKPKYSQSRDAGVPEVRDHPFQKEGGILSRFP